MAAPKKNSGLPAGGHCIAPPCPTLHNMRYEEWYKTPEGHFALLAQEAMVRKMTAGWPRRGRSLLEMYCGSGHFLEPLWQSGFDVTGQEENANLLASARKRLGRTVDFTQSKATHLPYDDNHFDYVVCLGGLEFAENPQAVVNEAFRLATMGVLLAFPGAWSLHRLIWGLYGRKKAVAEYAEAHKKHAANAADENIKNTDSFKSTEYFNSPEFYRFISPLQVYRWVRSAEGGSVKGSINWRANMLGPRRSWRVGSRIGHINLFSVPLPIGAFSMVRIDLAPAFAGNQLLINNKPAVAPKAVSAGVGRSAQSSLHKAPVSKNKPI
ncbi:class I SAM-dependent methyltransferase [Desulfovibrio sp. OttesenSCG-928-F07]|nr:class I SAM-dependent methyltransferase [Desulfovibrio sp. OttesenSCG-928-F07]